MKTSKLKSSIFFLPFLLCFIAFWLVPFVYGVYLSLRKFSLTKSDGGFIGLDNYTTIFNAESMYNQLFFMGLKNTLTFVAISVVPLVIVGLSLALIVYFLPKKLRVFFRTIFFVSYAISVTAVASIFIWLLNGNGGFVNSVLLNMSIINTPIPWLETQPFAWISIVIATVWWTTGYNMMLFINALNDIDPALFEASSLDGANGVTNLLYIILPNIKSVFYFVTMTSIIASFNLYGQSYLMTRGNPQQTTQTLIHVINNVVFDKSNLAMGSAMAIMMGAIVMCFSIAQYFLTREKKLIEEVRK